MGEIKPGMKLNKPLATADPKNSKEAIGEEKGDTVSWVTGRPGAKILVGERREETDSNQILT